MLLEGEEGLEAMPLDGILGDGCLLDAKLGELVLEVAVVLANMAQIGVVGPCAADSVPEAKEKALHGSDGRDDPVAHEGDAVGVRGGDVDGAAHLHGEADDLHKQNRDEDQAVLEA